MKRSILSAFMVAILMGNSVNGTGNNTCKTNIIYPRTENVTINSPKTYFVGNECPKCNLTVNGNIVTIHPSGGFKYPVNLEYGINKFTFDNGCEQKTYTITRPSPVISATKPAAKTIKNYDKEIIITIKDDNTPLRSTPVDAGLNRLNHLQKGIELLATGENNGFYKVKLGRDNIAYIAKNNAVISENKILPEAKMSGIKFSQNKKEYNLEIEFDKKTPYILAENNGLDYIIFNVTDSPYGKYDDHIETNNKLFGYNSYYNGNTLIINMKKFPDINVQKPLEGLRITIDAGHGGKETGTIGCTGVKEKDLNLQLAQRLKKSLEAKGAIVNMTRNDDSYVSLYDRVKISNDFDSDIFLSIHNNALADSMADTNATGVETYYFYPQSKELAKKIAAGIHEATGFKNGGARGQSFAVVRNTNSIAVLIEVGYMITPEDNAQLLDPEFQDKAIQGIINGLENYLR